MPKYKLLKSLGNLDHNFVFCSMNTLSIRGDPASKCTSEALCNQSSHAEMHWMGGRPTGASKIRPQGLGVGGLRWG